MVEFPESAAHVATDPNRVYYVGVGYNPCLLPGLLFFLTRPCLRPCPPLRTARHMLDGLRQGLVSTIIGICERGDLNSVYHAGSDILKLDLHFP